MLVHRLILHPNTLTLFAQSSKMGTVVKGFDAKLANRPFLVLTFWLSGAQSERQNAGKSKLKMVG